MTMKISDELRKWCDDYSGREMRTINDLYAIADRIDSEMVELPKDADGVPIRVGDLVYLDDGRRVCVTGIDFKDACVVINCWDGSKHVAYHPDGITRKFLDSWKFIAAEMVDAARSADDTCEKLADLADRIRKLAEKEGKR